MKNEKTILILLITILFTSCSTSVLQIGKVNMISNRNINPKLEYKQLTTFSGGSNAELKKSKAINLEEAIDNIVRKTAGGEFLMNVKIYKVGEKYFAVEGDVWGNTVNVSDLTFRGYKLGDKVTWKKMNKFKTGTIMAFKNDEYCLIKIDDTDETIDIKYDEITKISSEQNNLNKKESIVNINEQKLFIGQKVSWIEFKEIKYGIIQDINNKTDRVVVKYILQNGQEKIKSRYLSDVFPANENEYKNNIDKIQAEVKKHTFKIGDKVKWLKNSYSIIQAEVILVNDIDKEAAIKYIDNRGIAKNVTVDVFDLVKDE